MPLKPTPGPLVADGDRVSVEIVVPLDGVDHRFADFFTVTTEGRIARVVAYQAT